MFTMKINHHGCLSTIFLPGCFRPRCRLAALLIVSLVAMTNTCRRELMKESVFQLTASGDVIHHGRKALEAGAGGN